MTKLAITTCPVPVATWPWGKCDMQVNWKVKSRRKKTDSPWITVTSTIN